MTVMEVEEEHLRSLCSVLERNLELGVRPLLLTLRLQLRGGQGLPLP